MLPNDVIPPTQEWHIVVYRKVLPINFQSDLRVQGSLWRRTPQFLTTVKDRYIDFSDSVVLLSINYVQYFVTHNWFYYSQRSRNSFIVLMLIVLAKPAPHLRNLGNAKLVRKYRAKVGITSSKRHNLFPNFVHILWIDF